MGWFLYVFCQFLIVLYDSGDLLYYFIGVYVLVGKDGCEVVVYYVVEMGVVVIGNVNGNGQCGEGFVFVGGYILSYFFQYVVYVEQVFVVVGESVVGVIIVGVIGYVKGGVIGSIVNDGCQQVNWYVGFVFENQVILIIVGVIWSDCLSGNGSVQQCCC